MNTVLHTMSTRDALVAEVRRQILSGELRPGEPLTEAKLAARFGVARPTVRSALQVLVSMRLAQQSGGRSLTVPEMTEADVRDLFFVRVPLELAAVRAIVAGHRPLDEAEQALAALSESENWCEAHAAFHIALVNAAGSDRLSRVYPALQEELQLCLAQLGNGPDPVDEHHELMRAIKSGSVRRAQAEMRDHLDRALRDLTG